MKKNYIQPLTEYMLIEPHELMGTARPSDHAFMVPGEVLPRN